MCAGIGSDLCQPQTSVRSLLNSRHTAECFGACWNYPAETSSIKNGPSEISADPDVSIMSLNGSYAPRPFCYGVHWRHGDERGSVISSGASRVATRWLRHRSDCCPAEAC